LHLLAWYFFRPLTLRRYIQSLAPELDIKASLLKRGLWRFMTNRLFRRFLAQWLLALGLMATLGGLAGEWLRSGLTGETMDWIRVAIGLAG